MPWDRSIEYLLDRYPALRAVGNTPLVPVPLFRDSVPGVEVLAKMEQLNPGGSLKDRPVLRMLLGALDDGRLKPGKTVLDSSSGNAGIAYSMIGCIIGVPVCEIVARCLGILASRLWSTATLRSGRWGTLRSFRWTSSAASFRRSRSSRSWSR